MHIAYGVAWTLHLVGMVLWVGGLLILTNLMMRHAKGGDDARRAHGFLTSYEKRMHNLVVVPGVVLSLITGVVLLLVMPEYLLKGWMHTKLLLVFLLIGLHFIITVKAGELQTPEFPESAPRLFGMFHGFVGLLLTAILLILGLWKG